MSRRLIGSVLAVAAVGPAVTIQATDPIRWHGRDGDTWDSVAGAGATTLDAVFSGAAMTRAGKYLVSRG